MMHLRRFLACGAGISMIVALAACSTTVAESDSADSSESRMVATDQGEVSIPANPERIVVLNSNLSGYLYALDIPVSSMIPEVPGPGGGPYPEAVADHAEEDDTTVLPWGEDGFDFEAILAEEPDLILAGGQGYPAFQATESYDRLSEIAPTVIVSNDLLSWQEQLDYIADDVFGDPEGAQQLVQAYDDRVAEVIETIELPPNPVSYLALTAELTPFALPETSALPQTLAELGFEPDPVIADNPGFETYGTGDSFELSTEQVGEVLTAPTLFVFGFNSDFAGIGELEGNPVYANLPAFTDGHAYDLPAWAYRADYVRTMDLLDYIEDKF